MSKHERFPIRPDVAADDGDVERLVRAAGRRPEPRAEDLEAIRATARAAWQEKLEAGGRARSGAPSRWPLALAAALLLAVLAGWLWVRSQQIAPGATVATVALVRGTVTTDGEPLASGSTVVEGAELTTGSSGGVMLLLDDGRSIRFDAESSARLATRSEIELDRGAVYIDSPPDAHAAGGVDVVTDLGRVMEIGTQFEVRIDAGGDGALEVRVREGAVSVRREGRSVTARFGESLTVRGDGSVSRGRVEPTAAEWAWAVDLASVQSIAGENLAELLAWVTRETHWELRWSSPELEVEAAGIGVSGPDDLSPAEALDSIMIGSGLTYAVEDGVLTVSRP